MSACNADVTCCLHSCCCCCVCCCRNEALHIADHELQMFLRTLHKQLETVALHPSPAYMVRGSSRSAVAQGIGYAAGHSGSLRQLQCTPAQHTR
jgi:hypothetical protein